MCCLSFHPPNQVTWPDAFGWLPSRQGVLADKENRYLVYSSISNVASIPLSPAIGLIRSATNTYFLAKDEDVNGLPWNQEERKYLQVQISRGLFEICGGGLVLWVPDMIVTISRCCCHPEKS
ncbi:MAG: hypothetical protein K940chlam9_00961 [Chlamydiae bacterium]|nr:hypothetical protein [Chlamydiota bacterium]